MAAFTVDAIQKPAFVNRYHTVTAVVSCKALVLQKLLSDRSWQTLTFKWQPV